MQEQFKNNGNAFMATKQFNEAIAEVSSTLRFLTCSILRLLL
jgi:hypothetical protein